MPSGETTTTSASTTELDNATSEECELNVAIIRRTTVVNSLSAAEVRVEAAEIARDDVNETSSANFLCLTVHEADSQEERRGLVEEISKDGTHAILSLYGSEDTNDLLGPTATFGILVISPNATAPVLGDIELLFHTVPSD